MSGAGDAGEGEDVDEDEGVNDAGGERGRSCGRVDNTIMWTTSTQSFLVSQVKNLSL